MNMPGFTAEQSLKQHQDRYLQRLTSRLVEHVGDVRPQMPILPCHVARIECSGGNPAACAFHDWMCRLRA